MNNIKTDNSFSGEILVVEDDTDNLKYMSGLLTEANYQVRAANDGQLALRSIKFKLPDLILLDINMPGMNGVEVCNRLKSDSATADIPVIFISAEDGTDWKVRAFKAGGIDYVTKPIDPVEVLTRIDTHLNMYRLQKQLMAQSEQMLEEIKERIRAEQHLEENQLFLKSSLESSKDIIILSLDQNYRYYFFNNNHAESMNHVFGTQPEIGKCIFDLMQGDEDIKKVKEHYDRALAGESHIVIEGYGAGKMRYYYEIQYTAMYNPKNEIIGVTSYARNITERIESENKIKQFSLIFEESLNEIYLFDTDTLKFNMVNKGAQNNLGYTLDELQNLTPFDLKPEYTHEAFAKLIEPLRKGEKKEIVFETIHKRKDQSVYNVEVHLQLMKYEHESLFAAIIIDIIERKKAENKLIRSEKLYKEVQALAHIGHWEYEAIKDKLKWSDEIYLIFGVDKSSGPLSINRFLELIHPEDRDIIRKQVEAAEGYRSDYRIVMDDGSEKYVHEDVIIAREEDGEMINMRGTAQDITQLKKVESVLQTERDKLSSILDSMDDGVYIANKDYTIQYINPVLENEFGSYEGKKCHVYFHDSDTPCTFCKNKEVFAGKTVQWEWTSPKNGRTYDLVDTPIINSDGSISKLEIFRDITERKNDQEKIKASLKEKEILLSEIHHRVKNNMQVVISLLRLQAGKAECVEQVNILKESENRVLSMAMVHEMLYQSEDFSNIDFHEYVNNLLSDLFISYGVDVNKIKLDINCLDVFLDIENAIPCGLIINELASNALKYAFPDTGKGKIEVSVVSVNKDELELIISDNGVGIPKDIDIFNTESMGLSLVKVLSEETLEGKMELDRENGTKFHFKLKRVKYKPRI